MADSISVSDPSCTENKLVSSAPKCRKLAQELRKQSYFKKSTVNAFNLYCFVIFASVGLIEGKIVEYIAIKIGSEDNWLWAWVILLLVTLYVIYHVANAVVLAGKPAWIAVMQRAMLEEYSQMTPSDAWYVGESARYVKTWTTDLTAHEVKAIKRILELEEESIQMGRIKNAEEELLDQCRDTLTCSTTYGAITGRGEDTTDLRHVLITLIAEFEDKLKVKK